MFITLSFSETSRELARTITGIKQRSAVNPFLWALGVILLTCPPSAYFFRDNTAVMWLFLGIVALTVLCSLFVMMYFALKSPDKLRSEEYQIHHDLLKYREQTQTTPEQALSKLTMNVAAIEYGEKK